MKQTVAATALLWRAMLAPTVLAAVDVLLINARSVGESPHWSATAAARIATDLVADGHRVRWLWAHSGDASEPVPAIDGVEVRGVVRALPPFRNVAARVGDAPAEVELTQWLRDAPADRVHVLGSGAPGSVSLGWIADRMGATVTAAVDAREVLCHRQNLVHVEGADCSVWSDPERCADCSRRSLTPASARVAGALRWMGGLSPYPSSLAFRNRLEALVGGLLVANRVRVAEAEERDWLASVGVPVRSMEVGPLDGLPAVERDRRAAR